MKPTPKKKRRSLKVRRFFYVTGPRSTHRHILYGPRVEGSKTACGRRVWLGWHWAQPTKERVRIPVCTQCEAA